MKNAAEKILASAIKSGEILVFEEGDLVVKSAGFGDPLVHGFVNLAGRTAAPWIVTFESGPQIVMHPSRTVSRRQTTKATTPNSAPT